MGKKEYIKEYILFNPQRAKDIWGQRYLRVAILLLFLLCILYAGWQYYINLPEPLIRSPNVPNMPAASDSFDCDDSALFMYEYFTSEGYECVIVVGNLEMENETFPECKHVWVLVNSPNRASIAYDWGVPRFGRQHYSGFQLTPGQLRAIVLTEQLKLEKSPE